MEFLDNALDKAKEAIEIVSKKTEEVVTTQKQKFNIASLENQCSKHYEAIGKILFEKYSDRFEDDEEIKKLLSLISQKRVAIDEIKAELDSKK